MDSETKHEPTFYARPHGRELYTGEAKEAYSVACSCGWERQTNGSEAYARRLFNEHLPAAPAPDDLPLLMPSKPKGEKFHGVRL